MEIKRMTISNFKGIKFLDLDFGKTNDIVAKNGSGKSSIMMAFQWVLGLNNDKIYPRLNKQEINLVSFVVLEVENNGEIITLERRSVPGFDGKKKISNESVFVINEVAVLKKEYDRFIDLTFSFKALFKYSLVENMKWVDLRLLIMTAIGLQDKGEFKDEELNTLISRFGLSGAVSNLNSRIKNADNIISESNFKIKVVGEIEKYQEISKEYVNEIKIVKQDAIKNLEKLTKQVALCEKAVLDNEKRLEKELKRMLGGGIEVVLRAEMLNGNMKPTCSIMKNGVDFAQLSYSQKTLAQANLWAELCDKCGVNYPLWIDNYESIDKKTRKIIESDKLISSKQLITLSVGEQEIAGLEKITKGDF